MYIVECRAPSGALPPLSELGEAQLQESTSYSARVLTSPSLCQCECRHFPLSLSGGFSNKGEVPATVRCPSTTGGCLSIVRMCPSIVRIYYIISCKGM